MDSSRSDSIDPTKDFCYVGNDLFHFPICFMCLSFSPFLMYVGDNRQVQKYRPLKQGDQIYCPRCMIEQEHFQTIFPGEKAFQENSILNDGDLMKLLEEFIYINPHFEQLATVDRIIMTEQTKLLSSYKQVAKKPMPKMKKLKRLMGIFPNSCRMTNQKFSTMHDMCDAIKLKYTNLCSEPDSCQLYDLFDTMAEEHTPTVQRQENRRRQVPFVQPLPPILEPMPSPSVGDQSQISISSAENLTDMILPEREPDRLRLIDETVTSSESELEINISTDEASQRGAIEQPSSQTTTRSSQPLSQQLSSQSALVGNSHSSGGDFSSQSVHHGEMRIDESTSTTDSSETSRKRTSDAMVADSDPSLVQPVEPQPGPSGTKRRRPNERPAINPTVEEFQRNPSPRMPRLTGG